VCLMADPNRKPLGVKQNGEPVTIALPDKPPGPNESVLCLLIKTPGR
jgi:hypothetical protein